MKKWLHRIRGAVGTAMTWAVAWSGVGAIYGLVVAILLGGTGPVGGPLAIAAAVAGHYAVLGLIGGSIFSTVLGITEGRRRFDEMSLPRFASWGAVGGLLMSAYMIIDGMPIPDVPGIGLLALLGAGSAAGSLALARKSEDRELLQSGEEALGLIEGG